MLRGVQFNKQPKSNCLVKGEVGSWSALRFVHLSLRIGGIGITLSHDDSSESREGFSMAVSDSRLQGISLKAIALSVSKTGSMVRRWTSLNFHNMFLSFEVEGFKVL
jgi:hypothetical protein